MNYGQNWELSTLDGRKLHRNTTHLYKYKVFKYVLICKSFIKGHNSEQSVLAKHNNHNSQILF